MLSLQREVGNHAVSELLGGGAFNADFSDVRVHTDSQTAREIGARAFAQGSAIHFAPGEYRPGEREGDELIAHELAHVVQQRDGRAAPSVRLRAGGWADISAELEAEAWQQARRAAAGEPARPGASFSAPRATTAVLQGAFTVSATVGAGGEGERAAADLKIDSVQMTDKKRPPTRLSGSQGRHTVAWQAKTRYWATLLTGKSYPAAIAELARLALEDEAIDAASGAAPEARAMRARLLAKLQTLDDSKRMPESDWIETLTWAATTYVKAYQLSTAAAFASTNPKGRNEAGHLETLTDVNRQIAEGEDPSRSVAEKKGGRSRRVMMAIGPAEALASARGLVDIHPNLAPPVLLKVFRDWLAMLVTLYPDLFQAHGDKPALLKLPQGPDVSAIATNGYPHVQALFGFMAGGVDPLATAPTENAEAAAAQQDEEDEEAGEALEEERTDDTLRETEPFLVRLATSQATAGAAYALDDLQVTRIVISDERPPTRFGTRQMSHTIPWSLERLAWAREFTGTLREVVDRLLLRIGEDAAWSSAQHTPATVTTTRSDLLNTLRSDTGARSIPAWTTWLNSAIERYVGAYQASPFAAYGTEGTETGDSTARGRGEAGNLRQMARWEVQLARAAQAPEGDVVMHPVSGPESPTASPMEVENPKPLNADVRRVAAQLVDVPDLTPNRDIVGLDRLLVRWLEELHAVFPHVVDEYRDELIAAFRAEAVQSEHAQRLSQLVAEPTVMTRAERKRAHDAEAAVAAADVEMTPRRTLKARRGMHA